MTEFEGMRPFDWDQFVQTPVSFGEQSKCRQVLNFYPYSDKPPILHNVKLVEGMFSESLPKFKEFVLHKTPIAFLHIKCDIYSYTKDVFAILGDCIVPGTVIVFDKFYNYPGSEKYEFKAFQEFLKIKQLKAKYLAFNQNFEQVAVKIE